MSRRNQEINLVRNLIDFDESSDKTPRAVVEWWAAQNFEMLIKDNPPGFNFSPLTYMVNFLQGATANAIVEDFVNADSQLTITDLYEQMFLAHCKTQFRAGRGVTANAPTTFIKSELSMGLLDLARELEAHGEVNYEEVEEWIRKPKTKGAKKSKPSSDLSTTPPA